MSHKPSPRQERHADARDEMRFYASHDVLTGASKQEDHPIVNVTIMALPGHEDVAERIVESLKSVKA